MSDSDDAPSSTTDSAGSVASGAQARSALPSVWLRVAVLAAIIISGILAGVVGSSFARLSCTGSCDGVVGVSILVSSVGAAAAVAVIARIVLRGSDDWAHR